MEINKYEHIIWDFNGTILNDVEIVIDIMNEFLTKRNLDKIDTHSYKDNFDFPVIDYYKFLGFDFSKESFKALSKSYAKKYSEKFKNCFVQPYFSKTINTLNQKNISNSILSASNHNYLTNQIKLLNIDKFFVHVSGLDNLRGESKLSIGHEHIKKLSVDTNKILYIGDTVHDFQIAKKLKCDILLVSNGHNSHSRLISKTNNVISSLEPFYKICE